MKVIWTLEELGIKYDRIDAGMEHGIVGTPEYRNINPNSRVPTIEEDGFTLFESNTIVRYLCAKYSLGKLCPENLRQRADMERWMDWATAHLHPTITPVFWNLIRVKENQRNNAVVAENTIAAILVAKMKTERDVAALDNALSWAQKIRGEQKE